VLVVEPSTEGDFIFGRMPAIDSSLPEESTVIEEPNEDPADDEQSLETIFEIEVPVAPDADATI
jgi:hypothetical protein